jgi:hypothetical protein
VAAIDASAVEQLRTGLRGSVYTPGEDGYDEGRQAFNLNALQEPALVVVAGAAEDIVTAVKLARDQGLGVADHEAPPCVSFPGAHGGCGPLQDRDQG